MASNALLEGNDGLREVLLLAKRSRALRASSQSAVAAANRSAWPEIAAVNRAAIVLLCGHLENFTENLVEESLEYFQRRGVHVDKLPSALRILLFHAAVEPALELSTDTEMKVKKKVDAIRVAVRKQSPLWPGPRTRLRPNSIDTSVVRSKMGVPKSDSIVRHLRFVGLQDAFSENHLSSATQLRSKVIKREIDALVSVRNRIAHGELPISDTPTDADIGRYLLIVLFFMRRTERLVKVEVLKLSGSDPGW